VPVNDEHVTILFLDSFVLRCQVLLLSPIRRMQGDSARAQFVQARKLQKLVSAFR
jgi:hypothetical protein